MQFYLCWNFGGDFACLKRNRHLLSNTKCSTKQGVLFWSVEIRSHGNPLGNLAKCCKLPLVPLLLTCINFILSMHKWPYAQQSVRLNYLSVSKLHSWSWGVENKFSLCFVMDIITYLCWDLSYIMLINGSGTLHSARGRCISIHYSTSASAVMLLRCLSNAQAIG